MLFFIVFNGAGENGMKQRQIIHKTLKERRREKEKNIKKMGETRLRIKNL